MEIAGKIALVTGSSRRLGRHIALALARAGADVAVHFGHTRSADDAAALAGEVRAAGRRAEIFQADLSDQREIESLFAAIAGKFSRLDILVNNAAVYEASPLDQLTAEQWDAQMNVNARAAALCIRHALPLMSKGSAIVNIADSSAEKGRGGYVAYCASKAALLAVTRAAALSLAGRGIRVNAVSPGMAMWQDGASEEYKRQVLEKIPMRRFGSPQDVAETVLFIIRNDYITGQNIRVDGGWEMA